VRYSSFACFVSKISTLSVHVEENKLEMDIILLFSTRKRIDSSELRIASSILKMATRRGMFASCK